MVIQLLAFYKNGTATLIWSKTQPLQSRPKFIAPPPPPDNLKFAISGASNKWQDRVSLLGIRPRSDKTRAY